MPKLVSVFSLSLLIVGTVASPVFAQGRPEGVGGSRNEASLKSPRPSASPGSKLEACMAREAAIKTRSTNLNRMATGMLDKFDLIVKRVQDYYVASGKTVAGYDALVAAIATKRAAVLTALTAAQTDVSGFSCTVVDPKRHMTTFQTHMKGVKAALNEYRTAIKNLIVAVRSVVGDEQSDGNKSPRPSFSPKPSKSPNVNANPNSLRRYAQ